MSNGWRVVGAVMKSIVKVWTCIAIMVSSALTFMIVAVSVVGTPPPETLDLPPEILDLLLWSFFGMIGTAIGVAILISVTGVAILKGAGESVAKLVLMVLSSAVAGIIAFVGLSLLFG